MSGSDFSSDHTQGTASHIQQNIKGDRNQTIGQVLDSIVVYGQVILNAPLDELAKETSATDISPNPYRGLLAFQETDCDLFFGREAQSKQLWEKFRTLHETDAAIRLLPIYGPSGSGKSSLARAGLIPELARRPLPGRDRANVAILVPGTHPLEALATILARIATNDPTPVKKTREFREELTQTNSEGTYDGLRRIANALPDITISPLIILVDQFEEIYTLCQDSTERTAFIKNLLCAATDPAKRVSVIITMRSDFLGETQKLSVLNTLFAEQGFLVRAMNELELRDAISKPAEQAGHPLDQAIVSLLIEQTEDREGALPLLQFALSRIWEGLEQGVSPPVSLENIGGVGGALAGEAERVYQDLPPEEQAIARHVFSSMVQLGEGIRDTRRRMPLEEVISHQHDTQIIRHFLDKFSASGLRLITLSNANEKVQAEISHEALITYWDRLRDWIDSDRELIYRKRQIELSAKEWQDNNRSKNHLLQGRYLEEAVNFYKQYCTNFPLSETVKELIDKSLQKKAINFSKLAGVVLLISTATLAVGFGLISFVIYQVMLQGNKENAIGIAERFGQDVAWMDETMPSTMALEKVINYRSTADTAIWIRSPEGEIVAQSDTLEMGSWQKDGLAASVLQLPTQKRLNSVNIRGRQMIVSTNPLEVNGTLVGNLFIADDITNTQQALNSISRIIFAIFIVLFIAYGLVIAGNFIRSKNLRIALKKL
ncbi:MAG: ATP-binding protein [Cyanobacteria bacterium P01_H01_bin.21]